MKLLLFLLMLPAVILPGHCEDWTTTDGKVYGQVKVLKVEADAVTILYRDGGARIPLEDLPTDLQKKFNYNPSTAADAKVAYEKEQKTAEADYVRAKQLQNVKDAAETKAAEEEAIAASEQEAKFQQDHGVKPAEIESLCALVHLDEQAQANEVTTSVIGGHEWKPTTATTSAAVAADNHGNAAAAIGESVTYTNAPSAADEKRREERGLPSLWGPAIPVAAALLERPCTADQTKWLNNFIECAKLAGGNSTNYGALLQGLVKRPAAPPWSAAGGT